MRTRSRNLPRPTTNDPVTKALKLREEEGLTWPAIRERFGVTVEKAAQREQAERKRERAA